jgi:hypothetical protein
VKAHFGMPTARAARIVVYKTINTHQLVYDYVVQQRSSVTCREYLYTPSTGGFQLGMLTGCYARLTNMVRSSAGHR